VGVSPRGGTVLMLRAFVLIIVGLAGDPEHAELFHKWGAALAAASEKAGVARERVMYLSDQESDGDAQVTGRATREGIEKAFDAIAKASAPEDVVFVTLIGHGSFDGRAPKFNLPGPDIGPADFNTFMKKVPARQIVFVDTTSSSGPFIPELSGQGRTIITATRNGAEQFDTLFAGYFIDALTSEAADADKNQRISMLEAFQYAKSEVARAYEREGLLATEHPMLDDDGNKEGSATPSDLKGDGKLAAQLSLGSGKAVDDLPSDPKLRQLYVERRDLERRVEALRLLKESMDPARYEQELEKAATDLALKNREIRQIEGK